MVTKKGTNVMEFYLKNREFMESSEPRVQKAVLAGYSE